MLPVENMCYANKIVVGDDARIVPWALTLLHTIKFNVVLCPAVGAASRTGIKIMEHSQNLNVIWHMVPERSRPFPTEHFII